MTASIDTLLKDIAAERFVLQLRVWCRITAGHVSIVDLVLQPPERARIWWSSIFLPRLLFGRLVCTEFVVEFSWFVVRDEEHEQCICDVILSCPISCQLCGRLCSIADHLHSLEDGAIHLCGYVDVVVIKNGHAISHETKGRNLDARVIVAAMAMRNRHSATFYWSNIQRCSW